MRISDWSSDVCSSDLRQASQQLAEVENIIERGANQGDRIADRHRTDHEGVVADAAVQRVVAATAVQRVVGGAAQDQVVPGSSETRGVGKGWVSSCRSRWSPEH